MADRNEWDWPPARGYGKPTIEGRIERETIVIPSRQPPASWPNRAADAFYQTVMTGVKIFAAVVLTLVALACIWLISAILKA